MKMRAMGLDVGDKRVGIAVSDELGLTAQGQPTLHRTGLKRDLEELSRIAAEHRVERIVLGLPLNMDGSEGDRASATRALGRRLEQACGLPVEYWDERLSTVAASRVLLEANLSRARRKGVIDKVSAVLILQGWLDAHSTRARAETDE